MSALPDDLWILLIATALAVPFGIWAYLRSNNKTTNFAASLATAMQASVDGDACVVEIDGLPYRVRQITERRRQQSNRELLHIELATVCPAWFSVIEQDELLERIGEAIGGDDEAYGNVNSAWHVEGYRVDSASPVWAKSWLATASVRECLSSLMRHPVSLLRLKPHGVECRRLLSEADLQAPEPIVRALLDELHAVVVQAQGHKPELVRPEELVVPFGDRFSLLKVPFAVLTFAALAFLPSISLTKDKPPLPWGAELELGGGVLCAIIGLALFLPWLKARAADREHATDIHVSAVILMSVGLLLAGAAISRPLAYLFV